MAEAHLESYTRREGRRTVLSLEGTLDVATAPEAQEALQRFIAEHGPNVVVDLSRIDFIDSKGLGVLIAAAKQARDAGGRIFLENPAVPVQKILEMCGLQQLFPAVLTAEAAPEPSEAIPAAPARPAARRSAARRAS